MRIFCTKNGVTRAVALLLFLEWSGSKALARSVEFNAGYFHSLVKLHQTGAIGGVSGTGVSTGGFSSRLSLHLIPATLKPRPKFPLTIELGYQSFSFLAKPTDTVNLPQQKVAFSETNLSGGLPWLHLGFSRVEVPVAYLIDTENMEWVTMEAWAARLCAHFEFSLESAGDYRREGLSLIGRLKGEKVFLGSTSGNVHGEGISGTAAAVQVGLIQRMGHSRKRDGLHFGMDLEGSFRRYTATVTVPRANGKIQISLMEFTPRFFVELRF